MRLLNFAISVTASFFSLTSPCNVLHVKSPILPFLDDEYILSNDKILSNARPVYVSVLEPPRYLYALEIGADQSGRWLFGSKPGTDAAWAYISSYAITPYLTRDVSERAVWRVYAKEEGQQQPRWAEDEGLSVTCSSGRGDSVVFLSSLLLPRLTGLYTEIGAAYAGVPVWRQVGLGGLYLYAVATQGPELRWMVGDHIDAERGLAFIDVVAEDPTWLPEKAGDRLWSVAQGGGWVEEAAFFLLSAREGSCKAAIIRAHRQDGGAEDWGRAPTTQDICSPGITWKILQRFRAHRQLQEHVFIMSNGIPVPYVSFGSGTAPRETLATVLQTAAEFGYRSFDTASVYETEASIAEMYSPAGRIAREEIFILSKLWYSELGYNETNQALTRTLQRLRTSYLDAYIIHWPRCYDSVPWMDCSHASTGTWQASWRALNKAYAEAKVQSIGVSNFDAALMRELLQMSDSTPHIVQNAADVTQEDTEVLQLCQEHGIYHQAYSPLRILHSTNICKPVKKVLQQVGKRHHRTMAQIALRAFVQSQRGLVITSSSDRHLHEDISIFDFSLSEREVAQIQDKVRACQASSDEL